MSFSALFIYTHCMSLALTAYVQPSKVVIHHCKLMLYVSKSFHFSGDEFDISDSSLIWNILMNANTGNNIAFVAADEKLVLFQIVYIRDVPSWVF